MAMLQDELLVYATLEFPRDASAPYEGTIDGETSSVAEVQYVEEAFLRSVVGERATVQHGLEVVEDHGSLTDGENTELRQGLSTEGDAIAAAEQSLITDALQVAVHPGDRHRRRRAGLKHERYPGERPRSPVPADHRGSRGRRRSTRCRRPNG